MWTRVAFVIVVAATAACSGRSKSNSGSRGPSGNGAVSGTGGAGSGNTGGNGGAPANACGADGTVCSPSERCVPDLFEDSRIFPAGPAPASVELRDVDDDDALDAVILQGDGTGVVTLRGTRDGAFALPLASRFHSGRDFAPGDWNGDGVVDVVLPSAQLTLAFGDGSGAFLRPVSMDVVADSVSMGDLDADDQPDLVAVSWTESVARVLLGNGDGTFRTGMAFSVGPAPWESSLGDVNDDGRLDLAVINLDARTISVLLGDGTGGFALTGAFSTLRGDPWDIEMADWNADGNLDVATANDFGNDASVLFGNGDGSFAAPEIHPTGGASGALVAADFDRDGDVDLAVGNAGEMADGLVASLFLGLGDGTFHAPRHLRVGDFDASAEVLFMGLATGDLDADAARISSS
jgi:hypothetical protein